MNRLIYHSIFIYTVEIINVSTNYKDFVAVTPCCAKMSMQTS